MSKAKVAICIPSMATWAAKTAICHTELSVYSTICGIGVKTLCQQCSIITMARNRLVRLAQAFDPLPTHILFIDSDMTFPREGLVRLLSHEKDIVGAFYNRRKPPYDTVGHLLDNPDVSKGGLHKADIMPHGFVLIRLDVFDKLPPPWYRESYDPSLGTEDDPDGTLGEDVMFSRQALAAGLNMWCDADLSFETGHIGDIEVPCLRPAPLQTRITVKEDAA